MAQKFGAPIDRGWDHIEAIASTLANLRGSGSLAHELIQNADDAYGASRLTFRFTDTALIVEDDGGFTRCDDLYAKHCDWEETRGRPCDFHAFAKLGGATKKRDPNTTGAFGTGFLSVYQVTDRPELLSAGIHWVIDEEAEKALPCAGGCDQVHIRKGTRIVLPWADSATRLRRRLEADPVDAATRQQHLRAFIADIPACMLFLRRIERVDVYAADKREAKFVRVPGEGKVTIKGPRREDAWLLVSASFDDEVAGMRESQRLLANRPAEASLALRTDARFDGRLYATLPTNVATELPLHLNASFFPSMDRKGILLNAGFEAAWNNAAIRAAAEALASEVEPLSRALGPSRFWELVKDASELSRHRTETAKALRPFWEGLASVLPTAPVMWTSAGKWEVVKRTVLPPPTKNTGRLLEELDVATVDRGIRQHVPARELGMHRVDLARLVDALQLINADEECEEEDLHPALQDDERRNILRRLLGELVGAKEVDDALSGGIRGLVLWRGADGRFHSFEASYLGDTKTVNALGVVVDTPLVAWPGTAGLKALGALGDWLPRDVAISSITGAKIDDLSAAGARKILRWLRARLGDLDASTIERLRSVPLILTQGGLRSAKETVRAGGFTDHLGVTAILDEKAADGLDEILEALNVRKLTFLDYLRQHLPQALVERDELSTEGVVALIRECARRRDEIDGDEELRAQLTQLAWLPGRDGYMHAPAEAYLASKDVLDVLGTEAPIVADGLPSRGQTPDFLKSIGVEARPRAADIVARVEELVAEPPTTKDIAATTAILSYLARRRDELDDENSELHQLRELQWLACDADDSRWYAPTELSTVRNKRLFPSVGRFIALKRSEQERLGPTLTALGVKSTPDVGDVVSEVEARAERGEAPTAEILSWLDARSDSEAITGLEGVAFLAARDGGLREPLDVFQEPNPLDFRLAVLDAKVAKHVHLLDKLRVPRKPNGADAVYLLIELTDGNEPGEPAEREQLRHIRACWQAIALDPSDEIAQLGDRAVVAAPDGSLWPTGAVVLDNQPEATRWLSEEAAARVVPPASIGEGLRRAGVALLSTRLSATVNRRSRARWDPQLEDALAARQPQLARIVSAERGDFRKLMRFAERLRARSLPELKLRYSLEGIGEVADSPLVRRGAHYDHETGELFVEGEGTAIDWAHIALCVKDAVLGDKGPSVGVPVQMILEAEGEDAADALLTQLRFPKLPAHQWEELRAALDGWAAKREEDEQSREDAADEEGSAAEETEGHDEEAVVGEDLDEEEEAGEDDEGEPEEGIRDEADDAHQDDEAEGLDEDEFGHEGESSSELVGAGGGENIGGTRGGRGSGRRRGSGSPNGAGVAEGGRRGGKGKGSSADRRLLSYVTRADEFDLDPRNESSGERSAQGDAAVDLVVDHLREELAGTKFSVEKMPDKNKGYDVLVRDGAGKAARYIEVKSTDGRWGERGVGLSRAQFDLGREQDERFWLYVVEHVFAARARIWGIRDPARQVQTFQYDEGWQHVADVKEWVDGAREPGERLPR